MRGNPPFFVAICLGFLLALPSRGLAQGKIRVAIWEFENQNPMTVVRACSAVAITASMSLLIGCPPRASPADAATTEATHDASGVRQPEAVASVRGPIFSIDSCEKDADCAPVAMCHADRCAAVARIGPGPPEMMCTMECRGGTVDCGYNHCGCAPSPSGKKLCALLPGAGKQ
jgi:hypothetical protein